MIKTYTFILRVLSYNCGFGASTLFSAVNINIVRIEFERHDKLYVAAQLMSKLIKYSKLKYCKQTVHHYTNV